MGIHAAFVGNSRANVHGALMRHRLGIYGPLVDLRDDNVEDWNGLEATRRAVLACEKVDRFVIVSEERFDHLCLWSRV